MKKSHENREFEPVEAKINMHKNIPKIEYMCIYM